MPPILSVSDLSVVFDGFRAVDNLSLSVEVGELRFLIGPNGAGKTTLIDTITGLTKATTGSICFDGTELIGRRDFEIVQMGVGRSFQTPTVFDALTVTENIDLAGSFRRGLRAMFRQRRGVDASVVEALNTVGLSHFAAAPAGTLSHGQKQWLEIAMLLVQQPRLLFLDEPVAGMSKEERTRTGELLQEIARSRTVVVVEHDMDFVRRFASQVTVLHEGNVLCEGSVAEVREDPILQEVYLGRSRDGRDALEMV
jgi:urea transport system ATP-binding protein